MPTLRRLCGKPGCGGIAVSGSNYCKPCKARSVARKRIHEAKRSKQKAKVYDHEWRKASRKHLRANPWCKCGDRATEVDHVVPVRQDPSRRLDPTNFQSLCHPCHSRKTAEENRNGDGTFGRAVW